MKEFEPLLIHSENGIVTVTISRPEALNAIDRTVIRSLNALLNWVESQTDLRVMILTGAGDKAFVAGADIKEFEAMEPQHAKEFSRDGQKLFTRLERLKIPVIAAVNGFALGGGLELALACDFIFASDTAKFGLPECTLGLMPGFGGTVRLPRRVGVAYARELTFTGGMINAQEAQAIGLANKVVPLAELMPTALKLAGVIALRAPRAVAAIKRSIFEGSSLDQDSALSLEAGLFGELFSTEDKKEGVRAFIEKRKPSFKGK